jgi:hypothetical protein
VRDPVAAEKIADRVPAGRLPIRDHDHFAEVGDVPAGPLLDELGNGAMEQFVTSNPRLEDVVLDIPDRHRRENRARGTAVDPSTPLDEQRPAGVGVQLSSPSQNSGPLRLGELVIDQYDRHLLACGMRSVQKPHSVVRGEFTTHAEVAPETALELRLDPVELGGIEVDNKQ